MIEILNLIFGWLTVFDSVIVIFLFSIIVSFVINLCYKFFVDEEKAVKLKERSKELSEKIKEKQKSGNTDEVTAIMSEVMKNNTELMRLSFKPMMISSVFVILILPWLNRTYSNFSAQLPLSIPLIGNIVPFGWLGWYFISSIPVIILTRKFLGVRI